MEKISEKLKNILGIHTYNLKIDKIRREFVLNNNFTCQIDKLREFKISSEAAISSYTEGSKE